MFLMLRNTSLVSTGDLIGAKSLQSSRENTGPTAGIVVDLFRQREHTAVDESVACAWHLSLIIEA
jgi:hypothetical protein